MSSSACIRPDDDAASSVAADPRMMQQAQPKSAATRADATTARSSSRPIHRVGTLLSTSFNRGMRLEAIAALLGHYAGDLAKLIMLGDCLVEAGQQSVEDFLAPGLALGGGVVALLSRVGRNSMVVWKNVHDSQMDPK